VPAPFRPPDHLPTGGAGTLPGQATGLPTLWSRSYFAATVGAVSAAMVQRYIYTQYERPWRKEKTR
jgi:putative transposase